MGGMTAFPFALLALTVAIPLATSQSQPTPPPALTDAQKQMVKTAESDLNSKIAPTVEKVGRTAKDLNHALLSDHPDQELQRKLQDEFAEAVSQLVVTAIRLRVSALQEIVRTLTPEQKKLLLTEVDKPGADADLLNVIKKVLAEPKK
jgi:Spy/CpxP family protein refolding chaperone